MSLSPESIRVICAFGGAHPNTSSFKRGAPRMTLMEEK
jgi:hypothetical protein